MAPAADPEIRAWRRDSLGSLVVDPNETRVQLVYGLDCDSLSRQHEGSEHNTAVQTSQTVASINQFLYCELQLISHVTMVFS